MAEPRPLVLDVDGTFLKTDMLYECFWAGLGRAPLATLRACARHLRHPARLKAELATIAPLRTDLLPVNPDIAGYAVSAVADGREVVLASASDHTHRCWPCGWCIIHGGRRIRICKFTNRY